MVSTGSMRVQKKMSVDADRDRMRYHLGQSSARGEAFQDAFLSHQGDNTPDSLQSLSMTLRDTDEEEFPSEDPLVEKLSKTEPDEIIPLAELEKLAILRALKITQGNINIAAKKLGMGRATLYRRLAQYEDVDVLAFKS